jgi:hypothetical protein
MDEINIRKPRLSVDIGISRSEFEPDDGPLAEYALDGSTLSDICKSDDVINSGLCYQRVVEILGLEKELHS